MPSKRLGEVGGDHLEDPPTEDAQRLGVVLGRQRDQVLLGLTALLGGDRELARARQPIEGGDDGAGLGGVDLPGRHPRREQVVLLQRAASLRSERASRRTCLATTASQSAADPALVSAVAPVSSAWASSRSFKDAQLGLALRDGQRPALVLRPHREQRDFRQGVEAVR